MADGRLKRGQDGRRTWRKRARSRLARLSALVRMRAEVVDRPRRIDRFIDYFGGTRQAQPAG